MDVNNQGLNLPSNLQNLDVRNELLSTEVGSGASCAFSLRDLTGSNKKAVRVRREPHDETNSIDDERIFGGQEVQAGILEDWANGKLEHTLPCDVDTVSAGYSLRKIKADYSDNAVRIRRGSDDVEVDVAFDSDDKVSASSAITNVAEQGGESGSTTATTLESFLSEKAPNFSGNSLNFDGSSTYVQVTQFTLSGDFTVSFDVFVDFNNGGGGRIAGRTSAAGWIGNLTDGSLTVRADGQSGKTISFDSTLSSGEHSFILSRSSGTISLSIDGVTQSDTESETNNFTINFIGRQAGNYFKGSIRNINFGSASYNGYGNTDSDWQDQVGSNNGTVNGTADKFLGDSAFVHTWYDQAGSNDAVQETAANQPKIAENGALLADGVTFDGTNDFLQTSGQVLTNVYTGGRSLYGVCKINTDSGYIFGDAGNGTSEGTSFYSDTASDKILFTNGKSGTLTTFDNITTIEGSNFLISSNYNNNNATTIHKNSNNNGYTQGTGSYNFGTSSKFTIGDRQGGSSAATRFNGSVQEIIAYNSDQSDNRFKIESNINNYYGLYNDANAFSANAQVDGTGSTVSNASKDGGTLTLSSASGNNYLYFQLTETVPATSGDIFISFNYESSDDSVNLNNVKLRDDADSAKSGDLVDSSGSAITIQKNGFYSGKLASANLTNTGTRLAFLTNQTTDGYTFTISNLRYSRIARNGLVETWYDQSGNGRDATQGTAANQPAIVQNGGLSSDGLDFDGSNDLLDITNSLPITGANARSVFAVVNKDVSSSSDNILGIGDNGSGVNSQLWNLATTYGLYYNGGNTVFGAGSLNTEQLITAIYPSTATDSGDTVLFIDGSASSITSNVDTTLATDNTIARIGSGGGSAGGLLDGSLKEIIVFDSDKLSDRTDIEQDIKNFYNI